MVKNYKFSICISVVILLTNICCKKENLSEPQTISYPAFSPEIPVTILNYNDHSMEPFISKDGQTLFFNSLNDGVNTSLFYATRLNDSTFEFKSAIGNVNGNSPHLDAVASADRNNQFYHITTRDYPKKYENIIRGYYANGIVSDVERVKGNFYIKKNGWLIMDAEIDENGNSLYYVNAHFSGSGIPDDTKLGIAIKKDNEFKTMKGAKELLANVNNSEYLIYAPCISKSGYELYFTRIKKGSLESEICVSVRTSEHEKFSAPQSIISGVDIPEAPSLTSDGTNLYYHRKQGGTYKIFLKKRV